ncbi:MAG: glycosyltransferase [Actinomycetota bacterium]|nr:glycosyltransferase [Actinomycetota bacterium]
MGSIEQRERTIDGPPGAALLALLVQRGILSNVEAAIAEEAHRREGGWIGTSLLAHGLVSRRELYGALADSLGLEFVDLLEHPPQSELLLTDHLRSMMSDWWCPWRITGEESDRTLVVATADPEMLPLEGLRSVFQVGRVTVAITTDWDILQTVLSIGAVPIADQAASALERARPDLSARFGPSLSQKLFALTCVLGLLGLAIWDPFVGLATLLWLLSSLFCVSILTKGLLFWAGAKSVRAEREARLRHIIEHGRPPQPVVIPDRDLPVYTILVPCYHEANILPNLVDHISSLDYPRSKLQVLLLLEADDVETLEAAKALRFPDYLRIVIVPDGEPRTKPRACNVGLSLARGEFLVIYDAEDRPEPGQLRDVVSKFREGGDYLGCIQARLNYFNTDQNFITRMFTLEYSMWFDYILPGLDKLKVPIPLGGTSNHFKVSILRELGGWDPWNVTEDADLGIRATALGYRVGTINSTTWEEACSAWWPWIRQRTRWIKGYMVTTIVHTRSIVGLYRATGWRGVASLLFFIAGTPIAFLLNPIVLLLGLYGVLALPLPNFRLPSVLSILSLTTLVVGASTMALLTAMAAQRRRQWSIIGYSLCNPAYWLLHSTAAWRALYQLVRDPSGWEKTPHGLVVGQDDVPKEN